MFLLRQATVDDAPTLLKLAKMVHFINLPADPDILKSKIVRSRKSFAGRAPSEREREFMFVLEDCDTGNVLGTSSLISAISWPGRPHTFLKVRKRELYSEDLQTGQVHVTLQLGTDETGPSELGGLILSPAYRGHREKLGLQLSLIRFHFLGLHREWFADRMIAEMMGPLTEDSQNLLWEYLGRRFINLSFSEADLFCQRSKEFITALFPKEEIYVSLLPPEARNLIGRVGADTEPARRALERIGFKYTGSIDPFDAGPYLEAAVEEIEPVTVTRAVVIGGLSEKFDGTAFISTHVDQSFRAIKTGYAEQGDAISISADAAESLDVQVGDSVGLTPLPSFDTKSAEGATKASASDTPEAVR